MQAVQHEGHYVDPETHELLTGEFDITEYGGGRAHIVNGIIHRPLKDGPAIVDFMGSKYYVVSGNIDRIVFPWQTELEPTKVKVTVKNAGISRINSIRN